jgi:hypothetical protein
LLLVQTRQKAGLFEPSLISVEAGGAIFATHLIAQGFDLGGFAFTSSVKVRPRTPRAINSLGETKSLITEPSGEFKLALAKTATRTKAEDSAKNMRSEIHAPVAKTIRTNGTPGRSIQPLSETATHCSWPGSSMVVISGLPSRFTD